MIWSLHLTKPILAVTEAQAKLPSCHLPEQCWWEGAARGLRSNTHQRWVQPGQAAGDLAQLWFSVQRDGDPPPLRPLSQCLTTLGVKNVLPTSSARAAFALCSSRGKKQ